MSYTQKVLDELKARYPEQPEFIQAATEVLGTIQPAHRRPSRVRGGRSA